MALNSSSTMYTLKINWLGQWFSSQLSGPLCHLLLGLQKYHWVAAAHTQGYYCNPVKADNSFGMARDVHGSLIQKPMATGTAGRRAEAQTMFWDPVLVKIQICCHSGQINGSTASTNWLEKPNSHGLSHPWLLAHPQPVGGWISPCCILFLLGGWIQILEGPFPTPLGNSQDSVQEIGGGGREGKRWGPVSKFNLLVVFFFRKPFLYFEHLNSIHPSSG